MPLRLIMQTCMEKNHLNKQTCMGKLRIFCFEFQTIICGRCMVQPTFLQKKPLDFVIINPQSIFNIHHCAFFVFCTNLPDLTCDLIVVHLRTCFVMYLSSFVPLGLAWPRTHQKINWQKDNFLRRRNRTQRPRAIIAPAITS